MFWKETVDLPLYFLSGKGGVSTCFYDADFISLGIENSGHPWAAMQLRTQGRGEGEKAPEPRGGCAPAGAAAAAAPPAASAGHSTARAPGEPDATCEASTPNETQPSRGGLNQQNSRPPAATSLPSRSLFKVVARAIVPIPRVVKNNERRKLRLVMSFWIKI